ncbi:hypothetical protein LZ30DRAFT_399745 [Colletotrichum cereale]|nr:hypothetical protein LZ30DRAFT_399745 [Colletotrichum cereale]
MTENSATNPAASKRDAVAPNASHISYATEGAEAGCLGLELAGPVGGLFIWSLFTPATVQPQPTRECRYVCKVRTCMAEARPSRSKGVFLFLPSTCCYISLRPIHQPLSGCSNGDPSSSCHSTAAHATEQCLHHHHYLDLIMRTNYSCRMRIAVQNSASIKPL